MTQKPPSEQCITELCKLISQYCNSINCPSSKPLDDIEAIYMVFFRKTGKARIHFIGQIGIEMLIATIEKTIRMIMEENIGKCEYAT